MPFKKKVVKKEVKVEEDRVPYIKEEVQKSATKEESKSSPETIPIKILNVELGLTDNEKAMKHFSLVTENILITKDYPDKIVIVTHDGKKLIWPKG